MTCSISRLWSVRSFFIDLKCIGSSYCKAERHEGKLCFVKPNSLLVVFFFKCLLLFYFKSCLPSTFGERVL